MSCGLIGIENVGGAREPLLLDSRSEQQRRWSGESAQAGKMKRRGRPIFGKGLRESGRDPGSPSSTCTGITRDSCLRVGERS